MKTIFVIGIQRGFPLSREAGERLAGSDVILASPRLQQAFAEDEALLLPAAPAGPFSHRIKVIPKVEDTITFLRGFNGKASVLASGDPLFFGIGGVLLSEFPPEEANVKIYPAISSVQLAFARAGISWEDAFFMSLHGPKKRRWGLKDLQLLARLHTKIAILTGGGNGPCEIARHLPEDSRVLVLERLGMPDEKLTATTPWQMKDASFGEPNIMIVETKGVEKKEKDETDRDAVFFGLEEAAFEHSRGLITKDEARAVILHKLRLPAEGVLWDIGSGSGSVAVEAKRLSPGLKVYAVERDPERAAQVSRNSERFAAGRVNVVRGEAPFAFLGLPAPDRVFIGGSGGRLADIIKSVSGAIREGGIVVVSAITLENISEALSLLGKEGFFARIEASNLAVSRMASVEQDGTGKHYMKALNPVFIIRGIK